MTEKEDIRQSKCPMCLLFWSLKRADTLWQVMCEHFKSEGISMGTTTVYRNLERLVEQGIAAKYVVDWTTSACFEYIGENKTSKGRLLL